MLFVFSCFVRVTWCSSKKTRVNIRNTSEKLSIVKTPIKTGVLSVFEKGGTGIVITEGK
jgi:hypothetical protein